MGEGSASGLPWGAGEGEEIANGMANAQRGETPLRCAHVAPETTPTSWARRPNRTFLSENGQVQWEVGRHRSHLKDHPK